MKSPINTLFFKIFVWFWLTLAATLLALAALSSISFSDVFSEDLRGADERYLERLAHSIEKTSKRFNLNTAELVINSRGLKRKRLFLYNTDTGQGVTNVEPEQNLDLSLLNFAKQTRPQIIITEHYHAIGPIPVRLKDGEYQLYELRKGSHVPWFFKVKMMPIWLKALVVIGATVLLSLVFTQTLITPLNALRKAAKGIGEGKLDSRVKNAHARRDELGTVAQEFNAMASRLETLVNTQRTLLGDISHELRSPLTRLSLACAMAQDHADEATLKQLTRIEKESKQLDSLIERILTLSRLESRKHELQLQQVSLKTLLDAVLSDAQFEASSQQKTLHVLQPENDTMLYLDPPLIASAIENLLRNAIKYAQRTVTLDISLQNNMLQITIQDDGTGVAENELSRLTEPFYRVGHDRTRGSGGTGLGLAIAEKAISAHQGSLLLQNSSQGGLVAIIQLPSKQV